MTPLLVESLFDKKIENIICGKSHNICITQKGELFSFGINNQISKVIYFYFIIY